uniref:Putative LAGLIDADG homing endonuclease n=1 Tax=Lobochlamys segnis TaxID=52035 RepID=Q8WKZ6_9CHLO|nr:unknown [Lobochlamys segnis]ALO21042.1 putative LAGLIDADG homing endonuclease [Lobochlamys segnis]
MSNTKEIRNMKEDIELTEEQREIIVGTLLGDCHLETQNNGQTYRLLVEQSKKQHGPFVMHLYEKFKPLVRTPPVEKKNNLSFKTLSIGPLRYYGQIFYQEGKKVVPKNIHKYLTDRSLAYWYMDDGALKGKDRSGKRIHTESFTKEEVYTLRDILISKGIDTSVNAQNRIYKGVNKCYHILYITASGDKMFTERIRPYVIDCMLYKL